MIIMFQTFWKTERRWMRLYLSSLWILDTALQAAISYHYYVYFVKSIANPSLLFSAQKYALPNVFHCGYLIFLKDQTGDRSPHRLR